MGGERVSQPGHLDKIRSWPDDDHIGLMEYVESLWRAGEWGWKQQRNPFTGRVVSRIYQVSTGGLSGNEAIIRALEANRLFWDRCMASYHRGGLYEFKVTITATGLEERERKTRAAGDPEERG